MEFVESGEGIAMGEGERRVFGEMCGAWEGWVGEGEGRGGSDGSGI